MGVALVVYCSLVSRERQPGEPCTGCGQETACGCYDGDRKVVLCPECAERLRREPETKEVLLAEGPTRPN